MVSVNVIIDREDESSKPHHIFDGYTQIEYEYISFLLRENDYISPCIIMDSRKEEIILGKGEMVPANTNFWTRIYFLAFSNQLYVKGLEI